MSAQSLYAEALALFYGLGQTLDVTGVLEELASCAVDQGSWECAMRLAGAADTLRRKLGVGAPASRKATVEQSLVLARQHLGNTAATIAWLAGAQLPLDQAVAYARQRE